ncbi:UNVERIFIED_CONTAM: hypothetical protein Sradi_5221500 [Sesamum radiatum]|uniref:Reverse transcriptase zinc-binding domain-containing protein n=1 Tax=Sesamum radiatum TaxID=300843 RepID=A0AAW2LMM4_SESRA
MSSSSIQSCNIPLECTSHSNPRIWHYTSFSIFTVKSAYFVAERAHLRGTGAPEVSGLQRNPEWNFLWIVKLPGKMKDFGWRFCHGSLPLRMILRRRLFVLEVNCPICDNADDTEEHIFLGCDFARQCWALVGIQRAITSAGMCRRSSACEEWRRNARLISTVWPWLSFGEFGVTEISFFLKVRTISCFYYPICVSVPPDV